MAQGKLSFDEHAREAVIAWREALGKITEGEEHLLAMLPEIGEKPEGVRGLGESLDMAEKSVTHLVDIISHVLGSRRLMDLLGEELAEHEATQGPRDVRDKPTPW
jgi:hypothetical protein